jgi:LacI family transcriptional regulator
MAKRISQNQIAKELGVSQSLVSLVLNGRKEGISGESYNRIWSMAVKQGYVPRGMQPVHAPEVQHSYVGVILRSGLSLATHSNTFSHVQQGMFRVLRESGISTAFLGSEGELDEKRLFELLGRRDPLLGIVVFGEVGDAFLRALSALRIELLCVYASAPGVCHSVVPNEKESVEQLVNHLFSLGHRRFAWLGGNCRLGRNKSRFASLQEALASKGLTLAEQDAVDVEKGDRQEGFECAEELVRRADGGELPTAWICHNGLMARGAFQFALLHGIRVPDEISLAAVDRTRVCTEIHPFLTSAGSDPEVIGEEAARLLNRLAKESSGRRIFADLVVPSSFEAGQTSAHVKG